jgi:hypothetical protein
MKTGMAGYSDEPEALQLDAELLEGLGRIWPGPREARRRTPGMADPDTRHGPPDRLTRQHRQPRSHSGSQRATTEELACLVTTYGSVSVS